MLLDRSGDAPFNGIPLLSFYLSGEMKYNLIKPQRGDILVETPLIKEPKPIGVTF